MDDLALLREYAEKHSEAAFEEVVRRHVNLVHSVALRLTGDPQSAQDAAQSVFIQLALKAGSLPEQTILSGWLYRATQHVTATLLRGERRRRKREEIAMEMAELDRNPQPAWREIAPLLEQSIARLRKVDQDAVLMRFFEGKSLRELGTALGVSEDAAQKRVDRAIEKLRLQLGNHGVQVSAPMLAPMLAGHAVQAAPSGLANTLTGAVLAGAAKTGAGGFLASSAKLLAFTQFKTGLAITALALLILGGGAAAVLKQPPAENTSADSTPASPAAFVLHGTVRTVDGKPLAGALVRVAMSQRHINLYQPTNANLGPRASANNPKAATADRTPPSAVTRPDGTFAIGLETAPETTKMAVLVTSNAGYGLVTAEELLGNPAVVAQPWGRIEGQLRIGKNPGANQTVNLGIWGSEANYEWNLVNHGSSVKTDAQGRFIFARVAPIDYWLNHSVEVLPGDKRQSGHHYLKVLPGQTNHVQLGGKGYLLTGKVTSDFPLKSAFRGSMWSSHNIPRRSFPRNWKQMSGEERRQHEREWRESEQGQTFKEGVRNYEFAVAPDGSFRVEDVVPGKYHLQVRGDFPAPGTARRQSAVAEAELDLPELPDNLVDEPFDLGILQTVIN